MVFLIYIVTTAKLLRIHVKVCSGFLYIESSQKQCEAANIHTVEKAPNRRSPHVQLQYRGKWICTDKR